MKATMERQLEYWPPGATQPIPIRVLIGPPEERSESEWACTLTIEGFPGQPLYSQGMHDVDAMERLLLMLSVNVTAMYRDPTFFRAFRERVVPLLRAHPFVRIWHAGCSTGAGAASLIGASTSLTGDVMGLTIGVWLTPDSSARIHASCCS